MSPLFTPLQLGTLTLKNRIFISPMCQYSSSNGYPNSWHNVHLGQYSLYNYGMVITEATAVVFINIFNILYVGTRRQNNT